MQKNVHFYLCVTNSFYHGFFIRVLVVKMDFTEIFRKRPEGAPNMKTNGGFFPIRFVGANFDSFIIERI